MASGSQNMTTYYAKRVVGDASAAQANSALLQTGAGVAVNTWILNRTNRATTYGIKYVYDDTDGHDKVEFYGGAAAASAWVQLDTGDTYIAGKVGINYNPGTSGNNYQLYVNGNAYIYQANSNVSAQQAPGLRVNGKIDIYDNVTGGGVANSLLNILYNGTHDYGVPVKIHSYGGDSPAIRFSKSASIDDINKEVNTSWTVGMYYNSSNAFAITRGRGPAGWGTADLMIDSNGRVGIGITAPAYKLDISGTAHISGTTTLGSRETSTAPSALSSVDRLIITPYYHTGGPWYIKSEDDSNNAHLGLYYSSVRLLQIRHNGYIMVGDSVCVTGSSWAAGTTMIGKNGTDKIIIGYLASSTKGAVVGAHASSLQAWAPLNISGSSIQVRGSETLWAKWLDGCLSLFPTTSSYREGIRIHSAGSWSDITLCGDDNTEDSGTSANSWFLGNNNGNFYIARNGSPGGTAYIGCVSNVWKFVTAADIPEGAANLSGAATAHTLSIYRNGITIPYQMDNANDGGMLRVRGTAESNCILELGTWDDSGTGETIQFNYYPTTSQVTPTYSVSVPKHSGTLVTTDGHGASGTWGISITGNAATATKLAHTTLDSTTINNTAGSFAFSGSGVPWDGSDWVGLQIGDNADKFQISACSNTLQFRQNDSGGTNTSWSDWVTMLTSANYTSYTVTKTGSGASGSWGIDITGRAYSLKDRTNDNTSYLNYGAAGLAASAITWLCCWNGYEVRAISKAEMANAVDSSHKWVRLGGDTMTGQLYINYNQDVGLNQNGSLVIGTKGGENIGIDCNEIMARNNSAAATLYVNSEGGNVYIGSGGITSTGTVTAPTFKAGNDNATYSSDRCKVYAANGTVGIHTSTNRGLYEFTDSKWIIYLQNSDDTVRSGYKIYGAVWNDFAEMREGDITEGGYAVYDDGHGHMKLCTERLQPGARLTSDTFGIVVGHTETAKTPIGVAGRVLVYPAQDRINYKVGDAVCAAPGGKVDLMTREEIIMYPERILGIVSEIPDYEIWNQRYKVEEEKEYTETNIQVNGRIWVYIR